MLKTLDICKFANLGEIVRTTPKHVPLQVLSEPRCKSCNAKNNYIQDKNMHHFDFDLWLDIPRRPQAPSNPNCLHE